MHTLVSVFLAHALPLIYFISICFQSVRPSKVKPFRWIVISCTTRITTTREKLLFIGAFDNVTLFSSWTSIYLLPWVSQLRAMSSSSRSGRRYKRLHSKPWEAMGYLINSWCTMVTNIMAMICTWDPMISMVFTWWSTIPHGFHCVNNRIPWCPMGYHGLPWVTHGTFL